jgi:hypothetical protein
MTEAEWLGGNDPTPMLESLRDKASNRKGRLFVGACCRYLWPLLTDPRLRQAVEVTERYADGHVAIPDMRIAWTAGKVAWEGLGDEGPAVDAARAVVLGTDWSAYWDDLWHAAAKAARAAGDAAARANVPGMSRGDAQTYQVKALRDLIGNPFRPITLDPAWRTPQVVDLAQTMYDARQIGRMGELADALEAAGCNHLDVQRHCRMGGVHVPGCWLVDQLLGKE